MTPETDAAERMAYSQEYMVPTEFARKLERQRDEAREENKRLREALMRVRTWGIRSKNFDASDNFVMAEWIDAGCAGELPEPHGPWIYEEMEAAK